jgi:leader peptidase (prepilin peptidase)/N-methyltransferase
MLSTPLFYCIVFLGGLASGSFLNSVIYRLHTGDALFLERGKKFYQAVRSFCPNCHHQLSWKDLIPLVSFVFLRGRCRYCKKRISFQYPFVELVTGIIFLLLFHLHLSFSDSRFWMLGWQSVLFWLWHLFYWFFLAGSLIVIFFYDGKHFLIPDKVVYPAIGIVLLNRLLESVSPHYWTQFGVNGFEFRILDFGPVWNLGFGILNFQHLLNPLVTGAIASAFFLAIFLISRGKWMGFGDVKLAFLMGLFLGFPNIVTALFIAFLTGAIVGIGMVVAKRKTMKSEIPFGPFLVTGTFLALFLGQRIADWYWGLFI